MDNNLNFLGYYTLSNNLEFNTAPIKITGYAGTCFEDFVLTTEPAANKLENLDNWSGEEFELINLSTSDRFPFEIPSDEEFELYDLQTFPVALIDSDANSGQEAVADLAISILIGLDENLAGELFEIDGLELPSFVELDSDVLSGEEAVVDLAIYSPIILDEIPFGEEAVVDLEFLPAPELPSDANSGEEAVVDLATTNTLPSAGLCGSEGILDLEIYPSAELDSDANSGEEAVVDLATSPSLSFDETSSGEEAVADLEIQITSQLDSEALSGEEAELDIEFHEADELDSEALSGQEAVADLATVDTFSFEGSSGSEGILDFSANPADEFEIIIASDECLFFESFSTANSLPSRAYYGEYAEVNFGSNPAAELLLDFFNGECAKVLNLKYSFQLYFDEILNGEWANVIGMGEEDHWYYRSGSWGEFEFATSYNIPANSRSGELFKFDLTLAESEPIELIFYPGESFDPGLDVRHTAILRVLFRTSIMTQVDIGSATYFDLATDICCPRVTTNNLLFHMERGMIPEEVYYGNRTYMTVDLMCRPRMSVNFSVGEVAAFYEYDFMELSFVQAAHSAELFFEADLTHRLCKGYFIPTGDWIVTELNDVLPEDCYTDRIYSGENLFCEVSDDCVLGVQPFIEGQLLDCNLIIFDIWTLYAYSGENLLIEFEWTWEKINDGSLLEFIFYEPPIIFITGETLEMNLAVSYRVRFLEEGCLDNEFVFQDRDGDMIPELFNEVPVEEEPYKHSVKAECY